MALQGSEALGQNGSAGHFAEQKAPEQKAPQKQTNRVTSKCLFWREQEFSFFFSV